MNIKSILLFLIIASIAAITSQSDYVITPPSEQWYLDGNAKYRVDIGWREMWKFYNSIPDSQKKTIRVAIIDTGVDACNPEIGECIINTREDTADKIGHGTKVAGIICASQYEGYVFGISDIRRTEVVPIKLIPNGSGLDDSTYNIEDLSKAIKYAEALGCKICNISLNTNRDDQRLKEVLYSSKMLFVVSAGNDKFGGRDIDNSPSYPASYSLDYLITVTNIKSNGRLNSTANYGQCVDIAAPGTEIYNIDIDSKYGAGTGTSFSAPIITGLAAMIYICDEEMTAERCKEIILCSATHEMFIFFVCACQ